MDGPLFMLNSKISELYVPPAAYFALGTMTTNLVESNYL